MSETKKVAVVTGAGRGLGLEFAKQLVERGYTVLGTVRKPTEALASVGATELILDVADADAIAAFPEAVRDHADHVDLLINNAGINSRGVPSEQANVRFGSLEPEGIVRMVRINAIAPVLLAQALVELMPEGSTIVSISSWLGSIGGKSSGGNYGYCASKTTLNMLARAMAFDLRDRGITSVVVNPGWVSTDMGGPNARLSPAESVGGLLEVAERVTTDDAGTFLQWDGSEHPW